MYAYVGADGVLIRISQFQDPSSGETLLRESEDFWLEAGRWRWDGQEWLAVD